jgi:hypothetical protein
VDDQLGCQLLCGALGEGEAGSGGPALSMVAALAEFSLRVVSYLEVPFLFDGLQGNQRRAADLDEEHRLTHDLTPLSIVLPVDAW